MANNNNLFNAVLAGAGGGTQQRWITDTSSGDYAAFQAIIEQIATAIDDAIAPISGDANVAQSALMQSIVQAVFADRFVQTAGEANYSPIVEAIVALYTSLTTALVDPTVPSSGSGLTTAVWVDPETEVVEASQTGTATNPYGTIQQAIDYLVTINGGTVFLVDGDYTGAIGEFELEALEDEVYTIQGYGNSQNVTAPTLSGEGDINFIKTRLVGTLTRTDGGSVSIKDSLIVGAINAADSSFTLDASTITDTVTCSDLTLINASGVSGNVTVTGGDINATDSQFGGAILEVGNITAKRTLFVSLVDVTLNIDMDDCNVADILSCDAAVVKNCTFQGDLTIVQGITAVFTQFQGAAINAASANLYACSMVGNITVTAELLIDSLTYQKAINSGFTISSAGTLVLTDPPLFDTVVINVPAIGTATDVTYVNTSLVGTSLEGLLDTTDPVVVNPQADLIGAGAAIAVARISAANTLRVGFRGVTTGGNANFTVARVR